MHIPSPIVSLLLATLLASSATAQIVVLDDTTPGTIFDGIVDGFPGLHGARDGEADVAGNPMSVARQGDVTEVRSIMEFPLAEVIGQVIVEATLTFNVDDVIQTLGPGTTFSGQAASTILVHTYDADGVLTFKADYKRTGETPTQVSTGGTITDNSLKQTGARFFDVDLTARVQAAANAGTPFLGVLWRTNNSPTATSIDDGRVGAMPGEGGETSAGSKMPSLTITYMPPGPQCIEGTPCDDGNACTGDDLCTGGVCAGTPVEGTCDDGNACTLNDACSNGVCTGDSLCGNGAIDASCGETCDDGNEAGADGCSPACLPDTLPGRGKAPCLVEVAFATPMRTAAGAVAAQQICTDDDPACDADPTPDTCGFVMAACAGRCDGVTGVAPAVVSPNRSAKQRANREKLDGAIAGLAAPSCSTPVRLDVAVRRKGNKVKPGKSKVVLRAKVKGVGRDKDQVLLVCQPAS